MAVNTAEIEYTNGNAVYNLPDQEGYSLPQDGYEGFTRDRSTEWEQLNERSEAIKEAQRAQSVSISSVAGFAVVAVLIVLILLSYVQITEISSSISALESTLTELQNEQTKLQVEYESVFNLNEVKTYATTVLGMTKLTDANTTVVAMDREDKAVILANDYGSGSGIISTAREFLSSLLDYLR